MGVNRPDVSLGRCLMWSLSRTRRSRAAGSGGFFGPPTLHRGPDEPQYFADHRRRNPLYRKDFRCNYTFGTGTPKVKSVTRDFRRYRQLPFICPPTRTAAVRRKRCSRKVTRRSPLFDLSAKRRGPHFRHNYSQRNTFAESAVQTANTTTRAATSPRWADHASPFQIPWSSDTATSPRWADHASPFQIPWSSDTA